jgi:glutathione synthase/RimK-type ligase-like ATP-grasp enzyme
MSYRLGIMTSRIKNKASLTSISKAALETGFDEVIAFTPHDMHLPSRTINAYLWTKNGWMHKKSPFPSIIYDIGYYSRARQSYQNIRLQKRSKVPFVGYSLGNKMHIHRQLSKFEPLRPYLIPTYSVQNADLVFRYLRQYRSVMLKPVNTWGGVGIIKITEQKNYWLIHENDQRHAVSVDQLRKMVNEKLNKSRYVLQPWLDIRSSEGNVADHRVLIQKNKHGQWTIRGIATRIGRSGYITSNLKRGGRVVKTLPYLKKEFGDNRSIEMYQTLEQLSYEICRYLEKPPQRRYVEFGIDFAIDRKGDIKIIEVNVKPGRKILKTIATKKIRRDTFLAPLYYALDTLRSKQ